MAACSITSSRAEPKHPATSRARAPTISGTATEVAFYGSMDGIVSLISTLAETHPHRLYIFESTAHGFNLFWSLWQQARADTHTQKAFFIGWWRRRSAHSLAPENPLYERYWDGSITPDSEQERVNEVRQRYNVTITPGQLAWYRWKLDSQVASETLMDQEYPWTEDDAFIQTGSAFFPQKKVSAIIRALDENPPPFKGYAYELGENFMDTKLLPVYIAEEAGTQDMGGAERERLLRHGHRPGVGALRESGPHGDEPVALLHGQTRAGRGVRNTAPGNLPSLLGDGAPGGRVPQHHVEP